jgi:O-antigen/teichoic acid export membrane protein
LLTPGALGHENLVSARLLRRAVGSAGSSVWLAVISLFTTPYMLRGLGNASYGIFAVVALASSHLFNLELGFGHATVRYLAKARAESNAEIEAAVVDTSFAVFLFGGMIASGLLFGASHYLVYSFFHFPEDLRASAHTCFRLGAVILFCSFLTSFFSAILQARGDFGWLNALRTAFGTLSSLGAVAAIATGGDIRLVFQVQTAVAAAFSTVMAVVVALRSPRVPRPLLRAVMLREMGSFALLTFAGGLAYQWMINGPPVILAAHVSSENIPAFSIPQMVFQKLCLLIGAASLAFFPFASESSAATSLGTLSEVFLSHLRLTLVVMGPIASYLAIFGDTLLFAWLKPDLATAAAPCLRYFCAAALVTALSGPPADVARGLGRPSWTLAYTIGVAVIGAGASLAVVSRVSDAGAGVAAAFSASLLVGTLPLLLLVAKGLLGLKLSYLGRRLAGPFLAVGLVSAAFLAARLSSASLATALVSGAVCTTGYAALVLGLVLDARESSAIRGMIPRR